MKSFTYICINKTDKIMRSIDELARTYPNKTGKELLQIQAEDKKQDELRYQEENKEKLDIINRINNEGLYYKGVFGNQYFYYHVHNAKMIGKEDIVVDFNSYVMFTEDEKHGILGKFSLKYESDRLNEFHSLGLSMYQEITKNDWDNLENFIKSVPRIFWGEEL